MIIHKHYTQKKQMIIARTQTGQIRRSHRFALMLQLLTHVHSKMEDDWQTININCLLQHFIIVKNKI